jgi:hypothetical protein
LWTELNKYGYSSISLGYWSTLIWIHAQSGMVGSECGSIFSFLKTLHSDFHSGFTSLHPY